MSCMGLVLVTPSHLKPGLLTAPISQVTLGVLMVSYSVTTLHTLTSMSEVFLIQLDNMVQEIDKELEWQTDPRPCVQIAQTKFNPL